MRNFLNKLAVDFCVHDYEKRFYQGLNDKKYRYKKCTKCGSKNYPWVRRLF